MLVARNSLEGGDLYDFSGSLDEPVVARSQSRHSIGPTSKDVDRLTEIWEDWEGFSGFRPVAGRHIRYWLWRLRNQRSLCVNR